MAPHVHEHDFDDFDDDFDAFSNDESSYRRRPLLTVVSVLIVIGLLAVPVWVVLTAARG